MRKIAVLTMMTWLMSLPIFSTAFAQGFPVFSEPKIASLDRERLFLDSDFGQAAWDKFSRDKQALEEDIKRVVSDLTAEELSLTEERKNADAQEFKAKAQAFDEKVKRLRLEQENKGKALINQFEQSRAKFYELAAPVLRKLMEERNIIFVLDQNAIVDSLKSGDITDEAIERVNQEILP